MRTFRLRILDSVKNKGLHLCLKEQKIFRMYEGSGSITRYFLILFLCTHFIWPDSFNVLLKTYLYVTVYAVC